MITPLICVLIIAALGMLSRWFERREAQQREHREWLRYLWRL